MMTDIASLNPRTAKNALARSISCTTVVRWSKCFTIRVPSGAGARLQLLPVNPVRQDFPVRVVLGRELPAAGMEDVAATLGCERLLQQPAGGGIARVDQDRGHFEISSRLLLRPRGCAGGKPLQPEGVVALGVADVATGMAVALLQEDRLHACLKEIVIERWCRTRCHRQRGGGHQQYSRHDAFCPRSRHAHPPVPFLECSERGNARAFPIGIESERFPTAVA